MSKVAIKGNASGTGTFTLEAPNSNVDRTLTLPDEAGTVLTSASTIDSSKVLPSGETVWPSFRVAIASGQTITNTSTDTLLVWDDTNDASANLHVDGFSYASGVFTVPVSGVYLFSIVFRLDGIGSGYTTAKLIINGTDGNQSRTYYIGGSMASNYDNLTGSSVYKLNSGDTVKIIVYNSADTSWTVTSSSVFSGALLHAG